MERVQKNIILKDLKKKMVLLVGPRQSGKTWLAKDIAQEFKNSVYLNYDQILDRAIIENQSWIPQTDLLIFDELHKMPDWKNYLKGVFDTKPEGMSILVTGSARLDVYEKIGDSLAGRYYRHYLLPLSLGELNQLSCPVDLEKMLIRGGFPEPYLAENDVDAQRWRSQYINSLLSTDVFEVENIQNIKAFRLIFDLLRQKVGSPISYQSLAQDAQISPNTVKKYIQILEAVFVIFTVTPYSHNIARSILKESKIYFYDSVLVEGDAGAKLENLVAVSLLKSVCYENDRLGIDQNLHYMRTKDGEEVDFALVKGQDVTSMIEVKKSDAKISVPLRKFHEKYNYPGIQIVHYLRHEYAEKNIRVLKAENFLAHLPL